MWSFIYIPLLSIAICTPERVTAAQEYLPPKAGGGKKPAPEPGLPANYDFSYNVEDNGVSLDFGHNEKRKDDKVQGSYHVLLPDGRMQLVEYEAGADGYKPLVMYMGTATYPPASDKFDGYHYNAASNRQSVRQAAPRGARQTTAQPVPSVPPPPISHLTSQREAISHATSQREAHSHVTSQRESASHATSQRETPLATASNTTQFKPSEPSVKIVQ